MVDVPCLDHLWYGQKGCLDVGQVRCFHEETSRKLPGGPNSSEGATVGPMVLSLAIFNNLVSTMSSRIGKTPAKERCKN